MATYMARIAMIEIRVASIPRLKIQVFATHTAGMHTAAIQIFAMHTTAIANFAIQAVVIPACQIESPGVKAAGSGIPVSWTGPAAAAWIRSRIAIANWSGAIDPHRRRPLAAPWRPAPPRAALTVVPWMWRWNPCPRPGARIQLPTGAMIAILVMRTLGKSCLSNLY
jgi:hypothetical protein